MRGYTNAKKKSSVMCICPKCRKEHKVKIRWIGRGVPRIYCNSCRSKVGPIYSLDYKNGSRAIAKKSYSE